MLAGVASPLDANPTHRTMTKSSCHCGAVQLSVPEAPTQLTDCNCSVCRRIGALWAYYPVTQVQVTGHTEHTAVYVWGNKTLRIVRCAHCGNVTHWEPLLPAADSKMGVNARLFDDPTLVDAAVVRRFDGAETWLFLD